MSKMRKATSVIVLLLLICFNFTVNVSAEETEKSDVNEYLETLTYDEFISSINDNDGEHSNKMQSVIDERSLIGDISADTFAIDEFELNEVSDDFFASNNMLSDLEELHDQTPVNSLRTAPTPGLQIFVSNTDSLKDGSPTTETILIWVYNDMDEDGDTIVDCFLDGFPTGYVLGTVTDDGDEIGFATRFFNPGTYTINYYITDSNQETNGIGYILDIEPTGDYNVYSGELLAADDVETYTVPIDYSGISTAAICFVQTGETDLIVTIKNEDGENIVAMSSSNSIARRWYFIDKPIGIDGVYNYTVDVAVHNNDYHAGSSSYRVMSGDKNDTEEMLSYVENAVLLGKYTATDQTYDFRTGYTPNKYESYYRFTADGPATVTAMTNHSETRFKILVAESMRTVYDSENDSEAHRKQTIHLLFLI